MSGSGKYIPPSRREGYTPKPEDIPPWSRPGRRPRGHGSSRRQEKENQFVHLEKAFQGAQNGTFNFFAHPFPGYNGSSEAEVSVKESKIGQEIHDNQNDDANENEDQGEREGEDRNRYRYRPIRPPHPLSHLITYIMIFPRAHPLWESGAELWSHTNSNILVNDWKKEKKNFGRPIPVFSVTGRGGDRESTEVPHTFQGWWILDALREVLPGSPECIDLLETKERFRTYHRDGRRQEDWAVALGEDWIKTRFIPVMEDHPRFGEMMDFDHTQLQDGEGARYVLSLGGLEEEQRVLEKEMRKTVVET